MSEEECVARYSVSKEAERTAEANMMHRQKQKQKQEPKQKSKRFSLSNPLSFLTQLLFWPTPLRLFVGVWATLPTLWWIGLTTCHVWTEVWLTHEHRWCHADSCETALECLLLYKMGWGKKLSYTVAFSRRKNGLVWDMTRQYTCCWRDASKCRKAVLEHFLEGLIANLNHACNISDNTPKERRIL